jgi:prepilin-type N-terminal cleavage/methylation domain-containing protein
MRVLNLLMRKNMQIKTLKQAGNSLLEILLVLAIIAILLSLAVQYSSSANNNQKMNMVRTLVGVDLSALQSFGINNNGFKPDNTTLSFTTLVNDGYLSTDPKNVTCTGTTSCKQLTPWSQEVTVAATSNDQATITIPLPSDSFCINLQQGYGANMVDCSTTKGSAIIKVNTTSNSTT